MTISEAFRAYELDVLYANPEKTRRNYRSTINTFLNCVPDIPVELLDYRHLMIWKHHMMGKGDQPSSIAPKLSHLRQVLRYLKKHNYKVISWEEIERPAVKRKDPVWLTVDEVQRFLSVIESPRDRAIFGSLFSTAARVSELLSLNCGSIVNGRAYIVGKGDRPGYLYFDDWAIKLVDDYLATRKDNLRPLFVSGQRRRIGVQRVEELAHIYEDMAGIDKNVTPHVLRHSRATDFKLNAHMDIYDIAQQLRHARISSTQIYVHVDDEKVRRDHQRGSKIVLA